ncbi:hypothetical protein QOT17_004198 [Balamuthia mandrillaris]
MQKDHRKKLRESSSSPIDTPTAHDVLLAASSTHQKAGVPGRGLTVLVCVDASPNAKRAFQRALELIIKRRNPHDRLLILNVPRRMKHVNVKMNVLEDSEIRTLNYSYQKVAARLGNDYREAGLEAGLDPKKIKSIVPTSDYSTNFKSNVRQEICNLAEFYDIDLLVLGRRGIGYVKR